MSGMLTLLICSFQSQSPLPGELSLIVWLALGLVSAWSSFSRDSGDTPSVGPELLPRN
jgi:hypothetical protein